MSLINLILFFLSLPNSFLWGSVVCFNDIVFSRNVSECRPMAVPMIIDPFSFVIVGEEITSTISSCCIIALNRLLVKGYHLIAIVGKFADRCLQFRNSLPNSLLWGFVVCFNDVVFSRNVSECRPMAVPMIIDPFSFVIVREEITSSISFSLSVTFYLIFLDSYDHLFITRKISLQGIHLNAS